MRCGFSIDLVASQYSFLAEVLYLLRMCIPIILIYIILHIDLNYKDIRKMIVPVALIISLTIIISDLVGKSFCAYAVEQMPTRGTFLDWFNGGYKTTKKGIWIYYATRGLFQSANQLSGVMVIILPILMYITLKENKIRYWMVSCIYLISMIFIATRVGALGGPLVAVGIVMIYCIQKIIHKDISLKIFKRKNLYACIVTFAIVLVFFFISPFKLRASSKNFLSDVIKTTSSSEELTIDNTDLSKVQGDREKVEYIQKKLKKAPVKMYYSHQAYPYTDDVDFWYDLLANVPASKYTGARKLKHRIMMRVLERDNRVTDYIVGISFTRASSFLWPERDFETQISSLGFVGFGLFVCPYIIILGMGIIHVLKKLKDNLYLSKVIYLVAMSIGCVVALASGHILNEIFPFVYLSLATGMVLSMCYGNDPEKYEIKDDLKQYFDKLYVKGKSDFYAEVEKSLINKERKFIVTANPETIMIAENNEEFKEILLKKRTVIVPDGTGIILGAKMLGYPQKETITGIELVEKLFEFCDENKKSVFLFGAKPKVIEKLNKVLNKKYPNMKIAGSENGYVEDKQAVFERIKELKPDVILVALGIPNQEIIIDKNLDGFDKGIFVGIGGSFDVLSGVKKRAPKIFIKLHLEWLYRILKEPKRIKRFVQSNIKYLVELSNEK